MSNVIAVMRGYFNAGCELGVLSWVFARSLLYEPVIAGLKDVVDSIDLIYLVASPEILEHRITVRQAERQNFHKIDHSKINYSQSRLKLIEMLPNIKINTSESSPENVADRIVEWIGHMSSAE